MFRVFGFRLRDEGLGLGFRCQGSFDFQELGLRIEDRVKGYLSRFRLRVPSCPFWFKGAYKST